MWLNCLALGVGFNVNIWWLIAYKYAVIVMRIKTRIPYPIELCSTVRCIELVEITKYVTIHCIWSIREERKKLLKKYMQHFRALLSGLLCSIIQYITTSSAELYPIFIMYLILSILQSRVMHIICVHLHTCIITHSFHFCLLFWYTDFITCSWNSLWNIPLYEIIWINATDH